MVRRRIAFALVLVLAFASPAWAAMEFHGRTEQDKPVLLLFSDRELLRVGYIQWKTTDCEADDHRFAARTWIGPASGRPMDQSSPDAFADRFRYVDDGGPGRSKVSVAVEGTRASERLWAGTFRARVTVVRRGKVFTRCRLPTIEWDAKF